MPTKTNCLRATAGRGGLEEVVVSGSRSFLSRFRAIVISVSVTFRIRESDMPTRFAYLPKYFTAVCAPLYGAAQ